MKKVALVFIAIYCLSNSLLAQDRCATVPYNKNLLNKNGINESTEQFETWLKQKNETRKIEESTVEKKGMRISAEAYKIPVVVHVVHNGQAYGVGSNVLDEKIYSQIKVLNEDFNRTNADQSETPSEFQSVAGSMDIHFELAAIDPGGLSTTGIVRVNGQKATWNPYTEDAQLKAKSYWPAEDYLNIWVTDLSGFNIGYAQFPFSDIVGGLTENKSALTDGVAIDYSAFGLGSSDPKFNLGRTATHEVAHYLGLRHIWGDDTNCTGDEDYVNDTPNQSDETTGCPTHPQVDCGTNKMFQNFLDYTDDACMNLFTQDQVDRMITVLENSPRRVSLICKPEFLNPSEDLKIRTIISPSPVVCSLAELKFTIKNLGVPSINSFKVNVEIDENLFVVKDFPMVSIQSCKSFDITIPLNLNLGQRAIYVHVELPNGNDDAYPSDNDTLFYTVVNNNTDKLPLLETFDNNMLNLWSTANPQNGILWNAAQSRAKVSTQTGVIGEQSWLVSPILNFQNITEASLFFNTDPISAGNVGRLKILSSVDCGNTYQALPSFKSTASDRKYLSLNALAGESNVRIAFVAINDLGEDIEVDNIEFFLSDEQNPVDPGNKPFAIYWDVNSNSGDQYVNANITFNLTERQNVKLTLVDFMGREIITQVLTNILNQTMLIPVGLASRGLYIVRLQIGSKYYTTKVYLSR